jgi:hypothetical protein
MHSFLIKFLAAIYDVCMVTIDGPIYCQRILLSSTNLEGHNSPGTNAISAITCKDEMKINAGPSGLAVISFRKVDSLLVFLNVTRKLKKLLQRRTRDNLAIKKDTNLID